MAWWAPMAEQEQNRSEQATPFKLEEARKQGQVAKSLDFNTLVMIWGLLGLATIWGANAWTELGTIATNLFAHAADLPLDGEGGASWLAGIIRAFITLMLPVLLVGAILAVLANFVQTGPIFTFKPLKPKGERINPIAGFKRIYNKKILFETFKGLLKLGILGGVAISFFFALWPELPAAESQDTGLVQQWFATHAVSLLFRLGLALALIGLLDFMYTRHKFKQDMMMSRREMKEEVKRREGDPLIRAKLRELQRENLKQAASVKRVPEADVLITNPEHLAIALRYERGKMAAPVLLAKGADSWAAEMRALARRHNIPIYERKPLARLLFRQGQLGQFIPGDSFVDVARIYADLDARARGIAEYEVRP
jgi:flagellar biosynthetic protein FlhB